MAATPNTVHKPQTMSIACLTDNYHYYQYFVFCYGIVKPINYSQATFS